MFYPLEEQGRDSHGGRGRRCQTCRWRSVGVVVVPVDAGGTGGMYVMDWDGGGGGVSCCLLFLRFNWLRVILLAIPPLQLAEDCDLLFVHGSNWVSGWLLLVAMSKLNRVRGGLPLLARGSSGLLDISCFKLAT